MDEKNAFPHSPATPGRHFGLPDAHEAPRGVDGSGDDLCGILSWVLGRIDPIDNKFHLNYTDVAKRQVDDVELVS